MTPVIILGSGNSGSSAVLDYLRGREDVADPLGGQEFRLIQERDGLSSLHRSLTVEFHPDDAMYAVIRFAKLAARLGADSKKIRIPPKLGYGFSRRIPEYDAAIADFLADITACSIGTFPLQDLLRLTTADWIRVKRGAFPRSKNIVARKPVPVGADQFMLHAKKLVARLFYGGVKGSPDGKPLLAFDQAGSFWSPVSSTQYFGDERKIIVVTRDPCDVYASWRRKRQICATAEEFARWQRAIMSRVVKAEWSDARVLRASFEAFVLNHENERDRICAHLGIDPSIKSSYNPADSRKSVGRHKEFLTEMEISAIREASPLSLLR